MKSIHSHLLAFSAFLFPAINLGAQPANLSLAQALQIAAKGNRTIQVQQLEYIKAADAIHEAQSQLKPSVNANASYTLYSELPVIYLRNESASTKVNDVKYGGHFAFDGNIVAQYPIINPALNSKVRLAKIDEQSARHTTRRVEEELAYNITRLYLGLLMNMEQQKVLSQSLLRNEKALADARSFFLQGKNLKTDTLSQFIAAQNLRVSISALENEKKIALINLNQLMGSDDTSSYVLIDDLSVLVENSQIFADINFFDKAIASRPDFALMESEISRAKEQVVQVGAAYKPQLWATGVYQLQSQTDNLQFWNGALPRTSFVGVRLTVPLYSGNRKKFQTSQADVQIKTKQLLLSELKSQVNNELITIKLRYEQALSEWQVQKQITEAAQINYKMQYERYRHGLSTRLELDDAELQLTKSNLGLLQATLNKRLLVLEWDKATGNLHLQ
jgi:outer membrane protein TolC